MSIENQFTETGAVQFYDMVSSCMEHVGKNTFNEIFLNIIEKVIKADQCAVFSYVGKKPDCYLAYNARYKTAGRFLGGDYINGGYSDDPLYDKIKSISNTSEVEIYTLKDITGSMSQQYKEKYFVEPSLTDKISVLAIGHDEKLIANFYRYKENGNFSVSTPAIRNAFWRIISQLLLLHYSSNKGIALKSPLASLSLREREVCEGILRGLTTEGIAGEIGVAVSSITTYRKRAYLKLGINSKTALFTLCLQS